MLILEKKVHESKIQASRMKYSDTLEGLNARASKISNKIKINEEEQGNQEVNLNKLEEQKQAFDSKMTVMKTELK